MFWKLIRARPVAAPATPAPPPLLPTPQAHALTLLAEKQFQGSVTFAD